MRDGEKWKAFVSDSSPLQVTDNMQKGGAEKWLKSY